MDLLTQHYRRITAAEKMLNTEELTRLYVQQNATSRQDDDKTTDMSHIIKGGSDGLDKGSPDGLDETAVCFTLKCVDKPSWTRDYANTVSRQLMCESPNSYILHLSLTLWNSAVYTRSIQKAVP
eukprot:scaffold5556_cov39-Cyclotella_meneghiniana.AAC.4